MLDFPNRNAEGIQSSWMRTAEENTILLDQATRATDANIDVLQGAANGGLLAFERQSADLDNYLQNVVRTETRSLTVSASDIPTSTDDTRYKYIPFDFVNAREMQVAITGSVYIEWNGSAVDPAYIDAYLRPWDSGPIEDSWTAWDSPYTENTYRINPATGRLSGLANNWTSAITMTADYIEDRLKDGAVRYDPSDQTFYYRPVQPPYRVIVVLRMSGTGAATSNYFTGKSGLNAMATSIPNIARGAI